MKFAEGQWQIFEGAMCAKTCTKVSLPDLTGNFAAAKQNLAHPSPWPRIKILPLLSKISPCPSWAFPIRCIILPSTDLCWRQTQNLLCLSEDASIFNLGQAGLSTALSQYGYGGKISSGQWACLSVSSEDKVLVTETMGQKMPATNARKRNFGKTVSLSQV